MPLVTILAIGKFLGSILYLTHNRSKKIAQTNIRICFPEKNKDWQKRLLKRSLQESGRTLLESLWLWRNASSAFSKLRKKSDNQAILDRAINNDRGTIFITPHFGSWEYSGLLIASQCDLMILYAPPKIPYLHEFSRHGRGGTGATLIDTSTLSFKHLVKHLKKGGNIGILPDQVPVGHGGVYAPFFGRLAYTSTLVCKLAKKYHCNVVLGYSLRKRAPQLHYNTFYYSAPDEIYSADEAIATRALNKFVEHCILQEPEQYLWSYKRFKRPAPSDSNPYI